MTDAGVVVVKVGGDVLLDERERAGLGANVRALVDAGHRVVVLHGGGPQVSALQASVGLAAHKVGGRRITSAADLVVVMQAICGEVNVGLTLALLSAGVNAFGCHGASAGLIRAVKRPPRVVSGAGGEPIDFGEVGDVSGVNTDVLHGLLSLGLVPVIATLGVSADGARAFNINADTTSVQLARELKAHALLMVTKVGGIFRDLDDASSRVGLVNASDARGMIEAGVISGGMIPKVEEALSVLGTGVGAIVVVGAAEQGSFRAALSGSGDAGTRITP